MRSQPKRLYENQFQLLVPQILNTHLQKFLLLVYYICSTTKDTKYTKILIQLIFFVFFVNFVVFTQSQRLGTRYQGIHPVISNLFYPFDKACTELIEVLRASFFCFIPSLSLRASFFLLSYLFPIPPFPKFIIPPCQKANSLPSTHPPPP